MTDDAQSERKPYRRERRQKAAQQQLQRLKQQEAQAAEREQELMRGREFTGHNPPVAPELQQIEESLPEMGVEEQRHIGSLWDDAYDAIAEVLNDVGAPPTAKIQAAKIVQAAREASRKEEMAAMPTRIVFETAAYVPDA